VNGKSSKADARDTLDIFDVPSEDEFATYAPPTTKRPLAKRRIPQDQVKAPLNIGKISGSTKLTERELGISRTIESARLVASSTATKLQNAAQSSKAPTVPIAQISRRGKTPQLASAMQKDGGSEQATRRTIAKVKAKPIVQSKTPAIPAPQAQKTTKEASVLPARSTMMKASTKPTRDPDVFDMPSSDDESHIPTPKPLRRIPPVISKEAAQSTKASIGNRDKDQTGSDDSTAAKKRKRRGSVASTTVVKQRDVEMNEQSLPPRRVKSQRQEGTISPGRETIQIPRTITASASQPVAPPINKPRRTRMRTVPLLTQQSSPKAQSSPAMLRNMVPEHAGSKAAPTEATLESTMMEDGTLYEIPDSFATPVRPTPNTMSASVTPRQKALFGSLLGSSSATPSMPSISKLQLTDSKPNSLLAALSKSKSDLTHSAYSKKTRLIANLKPTESSSDEDGSDSESDSESDLGNKAVPETHAAHQEQEKQVVSKISRFNDAVTSDDMDLDETAADTQTSQPTAGFGNRSKFTYAAQRSYLQETNPEDAFLMSMDMDDPMITGSQSKDSQTEDEEEASQARGKHELRRQGQNDGFELENMMLIDDMSVNSTSSIRRTALLELCAKMVDTTFAQALMDSSLTQQFLKNLASNGEIVFDFAAAVAAIFILKAQPTYTVLDEIRHSELLSSMVKLLDNDVDIRKIAKNRKTNLSKLAYESVDSLRSTILASRAWSQSTPETASPQLISLKAVDMLVLGLREVGDKGTIVKLDTLDKLVDLACSVAERCMSGKEAADDILVLRSIFSTLEAVSLGKQKPLVWSTHMMQRLALSMAYVFQIGDATMVTMAVKLCMNLTNNKPKVCQQFSAPAFVQGLVQSIVDRAKLLQQGLEAEQRTEVLDTLILSLGAMINLTEHNDQARLNVDNGEDLLERLVKTFVEGSTKTQQVRFNHNQRQASTINYSQAFSMEESQSSVAIGYLGVLIGNLCLNGSIKTKVRDELPGGRLTMLVDKIKEFVRVHEHANRTAKQYEGEEGQEAWKNYTARIMLVVEQLEMGEC
jgi:hypothetical protein